jgi:hypothetical protein
MYGTDTALGNNKLNKNSMYLIYDYAPKAGYHDNHLLKFALFVDIP